MRVHYYKAIGGVRKAVLKWLTERADAITRCEELATEVGAEVVIFYEGFVTIRPGGFKFATPPDEKLYRYDKKGDCWVPRRSTKAGRQLSNRMDGLRFNDGGLAEAVGMGNGLFRSPGLSVFGNTFILTVPADFVPEGCRRITDVQYEKLCKIYGETP